MPTARVALMTLIVCAAPCVALAQSNYSSINATRSAELSLFGGAAAGSWGASPSFGWSAGWHPSTRVLIEGSGSWLSEPGADGFAALIGPRVYLNTTGRAAPFLNVEAGLYHASVDSIDPDASDFYRDRMFPGSPETVFNDFATAFGGGVDVHLKGHIWARPTVRMLVAIDGWRTHSLVQAGFHISYNFTRVSSSP